MSSASINIFSNDNPTPIEPNSGLTKKEIRRQFEEELKKCPLIGQELVAEIVRMIFKYKPLVDEGDDAFLLRQIILVKNLNDPTITSHFVSDGCLAEHLSLDQANDLPDRVNDVWYREEFDSSISWHEIVRNSSVKFSDGYAHFKTLSSELFPPFTQMRGVHELLSSVLKDLELTVESVMGHSCGIYELAVLPNIADMGFLFKLIAEFLVIVSPQIKKKEKSFVPEFYLPL